MIKQRINEIPVYFCFVLSVIIFVACQIEPSVPEAAIVDETAAAPTETRAEATPAATEDDAPVSDAPISDEEAIELLYDLSTGSPVIGREAMVRILAAGDQRYIAAFIDLFRGWQLGVARGLDGDEIVGALTALSGQSFGTNWPAWVEWYGGTDHQPPPGFTTWKGQMLSAIDPGFGQFLQDEHPSRIRVEEIQWGGVVVDGIPALNNPHMLTPDEADYMNPNDAVFGMAINDEARAYPLRILDWHEMANDVIGGVPVSLAYCTLCGAAIAYDGRASDGNTYTFGSSGFLFRSNKLMYDRQTHTLWNQLTGEPVLGQLVETDIRLDLLPVVLTSWAEWLQQHPNSLVVDIDTGFSRDYTPGAAYGDYFAGSETMFPVWQRRNDLATKDQIYALQIDGLPKAYPLDIITAEQVVNDRVGDTAVVLIANRGQVEVEGLSLRIGSVSYTAGAEVRAYERGDESFQPSPNADTVLDTTGREWQVTEEALVGPDGETAARISGHLAYWFGWFSFFPNTLVYER